MPAPTRTRLAQWLRSADLADIVARFTVDDPELEGSLYAPQSVTLTPTQEAELAAAAARYRVDPARYRLQYVARTRLTVGQQTLVSGRPLASESPTPFELDGLHYASVASFYHSLKLPEGDPRRAAVARGERGRRRSGGRVTFDYRGQEFAVGSRDHGLLIARATAAKVRAHEHVRHALLATGASLLYMGDTHSQALGRYMPFALMILRLRVAP